MRLWHEALIPILDRQRLLGQHRECCALRGKGWGKPHSTVNYVFTHPIEKLIDYHEVVMDEMVKRGYHIAEEWFDNRYRGKLCEPLDNFNFTIHINCVYDEHDNNYYNECKHLLLTKNYEHYKDIYGKN